MKIRPNNNRTQNMDLGRRVKLLFVALLLVGGLSANAQMGGGIGLPGGSDDILDAPIDGFLAVGLIAGACLGLRKRIKGLKE